jgi:hypothetical protein
VRRGEEYLRACEVELAESYYGSGDAQICGAQAHYDCESEDCVKSICERHYEICPACRLVFCNSPDDRLHDCFYLHQTSGGCEHSLITPILAQLDKELALPTYRALSTFIRKDADGFGNPLPEEVSTTFAMAALCLDGRIEDIPTAARLEQKDSQRRTRAARQREARTCQKLGLRVVATRNPYHRVDFYKRSTSLIASGALITRAFTGAAHYGEQVELLGLVGVHKQEDFVRDRMSALQRARPDTYRALLQRAEQIAQSRSANIHPPQRSLFKLSV